MNAAEIYQTALAAGFSPEQAVTMTAIALAESGGRPEAHNPNRSTGDNSYGLWQINMIDSLGPARRKEFGIGSDDALFDPQTNAAAAFQVSGGGGNFKPWTTYTSGAYKSHLDEARAAAGMGAAGMAAGAAVGTAPPVAAVVPQMSMGGALMGAVGAAGGQNYTAKTSPQGDTLGDRLNAIHDLLMGRFNG